MKRKENFFGREVPKLREMIRDSGTRDYLHNALFLQLRELRVSDPGLSAEHLLEIAESEDQNDYEPLAHDFLKNRNVLDNVQEELMKRSLTVKRQVNPYIAGKRILDYGCGDGLVGQLFSGDHEVTSADIYKNPRLPGGMPFYDLAKKDLVHDRFDTTLLLTVLHHADNPIETLNHAKTLTKEGGRIIVNESVFGIGERGFDFDNTDRSDFRRLSLDEQWNAAAFIDHFANRVLYDPENKIPVPYNFQSPVGWKEIFRKQGLNVRSVQPLGIDLVVFPEYHVLYELEVPNEN
jgi:SAM-dependent methyltransferase